MITIDFYIVDIRVGLNIYGRPWLIEPNAALQMLDYFQMVKSNAAVWDYSAAKGNTTEESTKLFASIKGTSVMVAPSSEGGKYGFKGFEGATTVIIPVSGPLMKSDYCGALGTASMKQLFMAAENTPSVKTIILAVDSPGGTVDGTQAFASVVAASKKNTICYVDGMMCSAAYWIGSSCKAIYASTKLDIIGSIGTMCSLVDNSKYMEDKGIVVREYYASQSTEKNRVFADAVKGDGKRLIQEVLDPMNDAFMSSAKANRGGKLNKEALSGGTYMGDEAVKMGLIDGFATLEQLVNTTPQSSRKNSNTYNMNAAEIKAQHPEAYEQIVAEGVQKEKIRVATWAAWSGVDAAAAMEGIKSGAEMTPDVTAQFQVKAVGQTNLAAIKADNAPAVEAPEKVAPKAEEEKNIEAFTAQAKANIKNLLK